MGPIHDEMTDIDYTNNRNVKRLRSDLWYASVVGTFCTTSPETVGFDQVSLSKFHDRNTSFQMKHHAVQEKNNQVLTQL